MALSASEALPRFDTIPEGLVASGNEQPPQATGPTSPAVLAETHLQLVSHHTNEFAARFPQHVDRDDIYAAGCTGLVDAAHRYDPEMGVPFATFASPRIRGAIVDEARGRDWVGRQVRRDLRAINAAAEQLAERGTAAPTDAQIAETIGATPEFVRDRRADEVTSMLLALDGTRTDPEGNSRPLSDLLAEHDRSVLPDDHFQDKELSETLAEAISFLPDNLRQAVAGYYLEGRKLREIGEELGVTPARASQLRDEGLLALQAYLGMVLPGVQPVHADAPGKAKRDAYIASLVSARQTRSLPDRQPLVGARAAQAAALYRSA